MKNIFITILLLLAVACKNDLSLVGVSNVDAGANSRFSLDRYVAANGDTVQVSGPNLSADVEVTINDVSVPFVLLGPGHGTFVYTHDKVEMTTIALKLGTKILAQFPMIDPSLQNNLPQTSAPADQVCSDMLARDADGKVFQGTANCAEEVASCDKDGLSDCWANDDYSFALTADLAPKVAHGEVAAGITGTAPARVPNCTTDGQTGCIVDGTQFRAANPAFTAYDLRSGVQLAGITGDLLVTIPACANDGQINCLTSSNFPAVDKGRLAQNANALQSGTTLLGVAGTLTDCANDGDAGCLVPGGSLVAIEKISAAPKILQGETLGGVTGTGLGRPMDCGTDGQINCVAVTNFPVIDKSVLTAGLSKISSTIAVAGVSGTLPSCASETQTNCLAVTMYPAVDKSKVTAFASSMRSSASLVGVTGTLADCAADGTSSCVTVTNFPALDKSGAAAKILAGQTLGGVAGAAAIKPSDCATDGAVNCVTITAYPAMDSSIAAPKILTGQTLASVAGTAALTPNACASDAETDCVTSTTYPAADKSHLTSVAALFRTDLTLAGVPGALSDCVADGGSDCVVVGPVLKAAALSGAGAKIISGQTVAGIAGTVTPKPADCNTDGGLNCVTTSSYPAILAAGAAAKIVLGQSVGGITGTATDYRPSDCGSDGEIGCTTNTSFPTLDAATAAAKIASGDSLGGVAGTAAVRPSDCSLEGATNCVANTNFPTVDATNLNAQKSLMKNDLTIAGITGTMGDCASDGGTDCQAVAAYPATIASTVAAKVLTGSTLAGVSGSAPVRPADCATDGNTSCVATTNYPAIDKATVTAGSFKTSLNLGGVTGTLANCATDGGTDCVTVSSYIAANSTGAAAKILSGQTLAGISGTGLGRPADCAAGGSTSCVAVAAYPSIDTANLSSVKTQYRTSQTIATVVGTLPDCGADGTSGCVTVAAYPSMNINLAAAKIASGSTLGGIAGTAAIKPSDCSVDGATNCTTATNFPSIDATVLAGKAQKLRSSATLAGVTGTLDDCSLDGATGCVAITNYPALLVSGAAAKIRTGQILGGVSGTAPAVPATCTTDNTTGCVSSATYPAVDLTALNTKASKFTNMTLAGVAGTLVNCSTDNSLSCVTSSTNPAADTTNILAGNIKNGTTFAGVTGAYPSSTYPLAGATATTDLTSTNFALQLRTTSGFEYFTPAGVRYTGVGTLSLDSANIRTTIFGVTPSYYADCTTDAQTGCVAASPFTAASPSNDPWDITRGTTIAGVAGKLLRARNGALLSFWNVTSGTTGASASTTDADYDDTTDDSTVGGDAYPTLAPNYAGWYTAGVDDVIIRDPITDTNGNGACDAGEICQFYDRNTKKYWNRFDTAGHYWEDAITACTTGSTSSNALPATGWRLPTQKEMMQVYNDGIAAKRVELSMVNAFLWGSTTQSDNASYGGHVLHLNNGDGGLSGKPDHGYGNLCIYP